MFLLEALAAWFDGGWDGLRIYLRFHQYPAWFWIIDSEIVAFAADALAWARVRHIVQHDERSDQWMITIKTDDVQVARSALDQYGMELHEPSGPSSWWEDDSGDGSEYFAF